MLHLLLTVGLSLAPSELRTGQDRIEVLESAVEAGRPIPTLRALAASGEIEDPRVVKACFQALVVEDPRVRLAAIEALRFNSHPGALQVLHSQLRQGAASVDPAVEAAVVRAIGQHASDGSLSLLAEGPLDPERLVLGRARLLALGRVGTRGAVDALILLGSTLPAAQRLLFADDLRLALQRATGADHGLDVGAWRSWWQGARKRFEPAGPRDEAPTLCTLEWNTYWTSREALSTPAPAPVALPRPESGGARAVEASAQAPEAAAKGKAQGAASKRPKAGAAGTPAADRAERKAGGEPNGKPNGKPKVKPNEGPDGKPSGEPSGKPSGKPEGKPNGKPKGNA